MGGQERLYKKGNERKRDEVVSLSTVDPVVLRLYVLHMSYVIPLFFLLRQQGFAERVTRRS